MKRLICVLIGCMLVFSAYPALAADYEIVQYEMAVSIQPDGSAWVSETLKYNFDGEYNGILSSIDIGDVEGLYDLALYVDGDRRMTPVEKMEMEPYTYTAQVEGDLLRIQGYAPGDGGERVFRYEYRLNGLAVRGLDAAELNYKFIGRNNAVTLQNARLEIRFPQPGNVLYAFAHGALRSDALKYTEDGTLVYGPVDVRTGEYLEAHVLFPEAWLDEAPVQESELIPGALEVEKRIATEEAEEDARTERRRQMYQVASVCALAAFAAAFGIWLSALGRKVGFHHRGAPRADPALLEALPAAQAERIYTGSSSVAGLSGELLELVRDGLLELRRSQPQEQQGVLVKIADLPENRPAHNFALMDWLFSGGNELRVNELNAGDNYAAAQKFEKNFAKWREEVQEDAIRGGYLFPNPGAQRNVAIALVVVSAIALTVAFVLMECYWTIIPLLVLTALLAVGFSRTRTLTDKGERTRAALKAWCAQWDDGEDSLSAGQDVKLIPLGMALGRFEPMIERMERHEDVYAAYLPYWMYYGWQDDYRRINEDMHDVHRHNASVPDPNASSGGGGSSSSGGGGGGGGHGAW